MYGSDWTMAGMDYGGFWRAKDERIGDFDVRVRVGFGRVSVRYGRVRIGFGRVRVRFGRVLGFIQRLTLLLGIMRLFGRLFGSFRGNR